MEENQALTSMKTISSTIKEREQVIWEKEAVIKTTKALSENLEQEINSLQKSIMNTDKGIKDVTTEIEQLKYCCDVLKDSIEPDIYSMTNQRHYKHCLEKQLSEYKEKARGVIEEYAQFAQEEEERLQAENSQYRELQAKKIQLELDLFNIKVLNHKIIEEENNHKRKEEIANILFYGCIVRFARDWLLQSAYEKAVEELEVVRQKERESLKELLEVQEMVKMQYKTNYFVKPSLPNVELQNGVPGEKANVLNGNRNDGDSVPQNMDQNNVLDMDSNNLEKLNSILNESEQGVDAIRKEYSANNEKVRIVDDILIKPPPPPDPPSKQSNAKKIKQKFQNFVQQLSRSSSIESLILKPPKLAMKNKPNQTANTDSSRKDLNLSADSDTPSLRESKRMNGQNEMFRQDMFNKSQQDMYNAKMHFAMSNQEKTPSRMENSFRQNMPVMQNKCNVALDQQRMFLAQGGNKMSQFTLVNGPRQTEMQDQMNNGQINNGQINDFQSQLMPRHTQPIPQQPIFSSFFSQPKKIPMQNQFESRQVPNSASMNVEESPSGPYGPDTSAQFNNTFQRGMMNESYVNYDPNARDGDYQSMAGHFDRSLENASFGDDSFTGPQFSPLASPENAGNAPSFLPFQPANNAATQQGFTFGQSSNRFNLF